MAIQTRYQSSLGYSKYSFLKFPPHSQLAIMTYLLSFLTSELTAKEPTQFLCYYINHSKDIELIRVMCGEKCHFERIIFSKERLVFAVSLESHLEVSSFLDNHAQLRKIDCKSLRIHESTSKNLIFFESNQMIC